MNIIKQKYTIYKISNEKGSYIFYSIKCDTTKSAALYIKNALKHKKLSKEALAIATADFVTTIVTFAETKRDVRFLKKQIIIDTKDAVNKCGRQLVNEDRQEYYLNNKERIDKYHRIYYKNHKQKNNLKN